MAKAKEFRKRLLKFSDKIKDRTDEVVAFIAFRFFQSLVLLTPVQTGRLRGNWQFSVSGNPNRSVDDVSFGKAGSGAQISAQFALNKAIALLDDVKAGVDIIFSQNLGYVIPVNFGDGTREGHFFIEQAIMEQSGLLE